MRPVLIALIALLAGCEGTLPWYYNNPDKQAVEIDGKRVYVLQRSATEFDAWGNGDTSLSAVTIKQQRIAAVEKLSHCKVVAAEYNAVSYVLQTTVACN